MLLLKDIERQVGAGWVCHAALLWLLWHMKAQGIPDRRRRCRFCGRVHWHVHSEKKDVGERSRHRCTVYVGCCRFSLSLLAVASIFRRWGVLWSLVLSLVPTCYWMKFRNTETKVRPRRGCCNRVCACAAGGKGEQRGYRTGFPFLCVECRVSLSSSRSSPALLFLPCFSSSPVLLLCSEWIGEGGRQWKAAGAKSGVA